MSSNDDGSGKSYKGLVITLLVILAVILIGVIIYERNQNANQQQQIQALNKQVTDTKDSANQKATDAQNQQINSLQAQNAELQKQLDAANKQSTTNPTTPAPASATPPSNP